MKTARLFVLTVGVILMAGCAASHRYSLVESKRIRVGDTASVEPTRPWTAQHVGDVEVWTVDGFLLEAVRFYPPIADGRPVLPPDKRGIERPPFSKTMTDAELRDLILSTFFPHQPAASELRAVRFGAGPGFCFDVRYVVDDGTERRAHVAGAVVKERLHLIVYDAASLHYYGRYWPDVDRLLESVRFE